MTNFFTAKETRRQKLISYNLVDIHILSSRKSDLETLSPVYTLL